MAPPYQNSLFLHLPVSDLPRSVAFYKAIGFVQNTAFSNDKAAMMSLPPTPSDASSPTTAHEGPIKLMLLSKPMFKGFLPEDIEISDATKTAQTMVCLTRESREAVDEFMEQVEKNGGRRDIRPKTAIENGDVVDGQYGGPAADPDGHILEVMYIPPPIETLEGGEGS